MITPTATDAIPINASLYSIDQVSALLTQQFGRGFRPVTLRRWIRCGIWNKGQHYRVIRGQYKVYFPAVQQWAASDQTAAIAKSE